MGFARCMRERERERERYLTYCHVAWVAACHMEQTHMSHSSVVWGVSGCAVLPLPFRCVVCAVVSEL